ncbi:DNA recombination protein RmuC [uncultured Alcanivorax sp.]|uniref:DNA recombination protein RmuC n=1 Tax=uncultured Alcanivorax sp. TaxID=191215 RepID=UPI00260C4D5F|nr:DNA recombination protein RmuC [uncultured Alcanivorax sp.]
MLWNTEQSVVMAVAAVVFIGVGYLLAALKAAKRVAALEGQLDQGNADLQETREQLAQAQQEVSTLKATTHQQELEMSKLTSLLATEQGRVQERQTRLQELQTQSTSELQQARDELRTIRDEKHHAEKSLEAAQSDIRASEKRLEDANSRIQELKDQVTENAQAHKALNERYLSLNNEHTELKTNLERKEEHYKEQLEQLGEARQSLTKEFENLAHKIFEEKGKTFTDTSKASIDVMLKPFREQIEGFQKRVNEVHESSVRGQTEMNGKIREVLEIGMKMSAEANNLTSALKGDSQQRGAWGEVQLRRTLEMSGLIEGDHYDAQSEFKDAEGKRKRPDYLIKLPDGKHIIIDSKVSLVAYDKAVSAETPEEHRLAMDEHVKAIKRHIDDLEGKDYTNLIGMRSPSFTLMFMPIEPAYIEALKYDKGLFEYGYKKNIVLVSHTTLIPILRTVSNLWMIERSNAEAREISEKAGEIFNQVCTVAERLNKLGGTLKTVSSHYNNTITALAGQQGLYGKVERFGQLSTKVSKSLPSLEPVHTDIESERLALIVEPLEEPEEQDEETTAQGESIDQISDQSHTDADESADETPNQEIN